MGCDIHLYAEIKDDQGDWQPLDNWKVKEAGTDDEYIDVDYKEAFYKGRNYDLFAILADVRNGYGFAGVDTGDEYRPIAMPKGLPSDTCAMIKQASDRWNGDGHSHSYFTVNELLKYNWARDNNQRGIVSLESMVDWKNSYMPDLSPRSWCGAMSGGDNTLILEEAIFMQDLGAAKIEAENQGIIQTDENLVSLIQKSYGEDKRINYRAEWSTPYYYEARDLFSETLPRLLSHCQGDYDRVRIVFWFDN